MKFDDILNAKIDQVVLENTNELGEPVYRRAEANEVIDSICNLRIWYSDCD